MCVLAFLYVCAHACVCVCVCARVYACVPIYSRSCSFVFVIECQCVHDTFRLTNI